MSLDHVDWEGFVCLVSFIPFVSYILSAYSSMGFPQCWGKRFDGGISFRSMFQDLSLCLMSDYGVSVFVLICSRREAYLITEKGTDL